VSSVPGRFGAFLEELGYPADLISSKLKGNTFTYPVEITDPVLPAAFTNRLDIDYVYAPTPDSIFKIHSDYWNRNDVNVFIAVADDRCHIINAREKPNEANPLDKKINIKTFDYGINSTGFDKDKLNEILKESIDSTYFFDFVIKHQKSSHEVDKDLLLNLIALRNDLVAGENERVVHLLILRCLFIKYLEDREIYKGEYLRDILKSKSPERLIRAFNEIRKINGDIFKDDNLTANDIEPVYLEKLAKFFSCDYRSDQRKLFPYQFDKIPVQLISNVYEAFLKSDKKKEKGIFYTPSFIVGFMLSHTLTGKLKDNPNATVLDPACGSGAFLVESFKKIIGSLPVRPGYEEKKKILENRLFGIDIDQNALQIAAFSLYLALLETEDPSFIRDQIEHAHPILPDLIGKTLIKGNALTDDIFKDKKFDCIVSNPPWGSVPDDQDPENQKEREAINTKGKEGGLPEYKNVADYERAQAFLLRVGRWSGRETILSLVVKNSIFLNDTARAFRREFLEKYRLRYFYELSGLNKILFKKRTIGTIAGKDIVIGSTEPCAIAVFDKTETGDNTVVYVSPRLTGFSEKFQLIHYTQKDMQQIKQGDFLEDDLPWKVLVNGSADDFKLIKKRLSFQSSVKIECRSGFQPQKDMKSLGAPDLKPLLEPMNIARYRVLDTLDDFDWNKKFRRKPGEKIFSGERILIPVRPLKSDNMRFRGIRLDKNIVHKDNILSVKIKAGKDYIDDYAPYLAIINSSLIGYYFYHISPQWGKGSEKRDTLRNIDVENLPLPVLEKDAESTSRLTGLVEQIEMAKMTNRDTTALEQEIDDAVFDLYGLLDFEKEMIREFYQVNVERKNAPVTANDIQLYVDRFRRNFSFFLARGFKLNAGYDISSHFGAAVSLQIVNEEDFKTGIVKRQIPFLDIVKKQQLEQGFVSKMLNEDKVKIYDDNTFYIVKSKYFKDWTIVQAMDDASEEIGLLLKNLPDRNDSE